MLQSKPNKPTKVAPAAKNAASAGPTTLRSVVRLLGRYVSQATTMKLVLYCIVTCISMNSHASSHESCLIQGEVTALTPINASEDYYEAEVLAMHSTEFGPSWDVCNLKEGKVLKILTHDRENNLRVGSEIFVHYCLKEGDGGAGRVVWQKVVHDIEKYRATNLTLCQ